MTPGRNRLDQNYNCPCAHPSQCDNSCFSMACLERLSIRAGGSENAAYAFTEADDEGDYVTYNDANRAIIAAEARATAAEATVTALQEALEPFANSDMAPDIYDDDSCVAGSCDFTCGDLRRARTALTTIRGTK